MNSSILGFNGEPLDSVSGDTFLGNGYRAHIPTLMRFNCPDSRTPFGAGNINSYVYCAGDPVNRADPSGHMSGYGWLGFGFSVAGIVIGMISLAAAIPTSGLSLTAASCFFAATTGLAADAMSVASNVTTGRMSTALAWASLALGVFSAGTSLAPGVKQTRIYATVLAEKREQLGLRIARIMDSGLGGLGSKKAGKILAAESDRSRHIPKLPAEKPVPGTYLFRGIRKGHPHEAQALRGEVVSGNVTSLISTFAHNSGAVSNSPYTSWSGNVDIAKQFAGQDGIILRVKAGAPEPGEHWSWVMSEDQFWENEVLMKGTRTRGIEIFRP